jgi:hypothetical protein
MTTVPTILSLGLGVESTAILVRWMKEPTTRTFALDDLIVITAQTGNEYDNTRTDVEKHLLPLMREHSVRYVQVARHGHLEADGITVLSDTRQPGILYIEGDYKLSDELLAAGTLPQYGGIHACAMKFKSFVIESWLKQSLSALDESRGRSNEGGPVQHAYGYNADETKRVAKCLDADAHRLALGFNKDEQKRVARATEYDTPSRQSFFPLVEWGWTREDCISYLQGVFGIRWQKSACVACPFNACTPEAIERHKAHPAQLAEALLMEHVSMSLNPRGSLYPKTSLTQITMSSGNHEAMNRFARKLDDSPWALYRVRRIYKAGKDKEGNTQYSKKGQAIRAVEKLATFSGATAAREALSQKALVLGVDEETKGLITYVYLARRGETFPAREEFYVATPAFVETKARYGVPWFDEQWDASQGCLF